MDNLCNDAYFSLYIVQYIVYCERKASSSGIEEAKKSFVLVTMNEFNGKRRNKIRLLQKLKQFLLLVMKNLMVEITVIVIINLMS